MFRMNEWVKCVFLLIIDVASLLVKLEFLARVIDFPSFNSNRTNKWSTYQFSLFSYQRIFFILNRYYWNRCYSIRCPKQMKQSSDATYTNKGFTVAVSNLWSRWLVFYLCAKKFISHFLDMFEMLSIWNT